MKYYCIAAADGFLCPTWVLLVADEKMSADAFDYCEVQGLSQSRDQVGFLCFCRTRSGNAAFYKWLNENVLCKFVQSIRAINNIGENDYLCVLCDGEKVQIDPYLDASIQEKFRDLNCMIGKVAASCTALTQPLDAFNAFKASKSLLACFSTDDYMHQESLRHQVVSAIQIHESRYQNVKIADKRRLIPGILAVRVAIVNAMNEITIQKSFEAAGIDRECQVDINHILAQFGVKLTDCAFHQFMDVLPQAVSLFREQGTITDEQLRMFDAIRHEEAEICGHPRDQLVLSRQRCVILNHAQTMQRHLDRLQAIEDAKKRKAEEKIVKAAERKRKAEEKEQLDQDKKLKREAETAAEVGKDSKKKRK